MVDSFSKRLASPSRKKTPYQGTEEKNAKSGKDCKEGGGIDEA